jgi:hypothetical protein
MRRFLLCLLLLLLATPSFAQSPVTAQILASDGNLYGVSGTEFYSYYSGATGPTVLNASAPADLTLCLERGDGTLLGISSNGTPGGWQAVDLTMDGAITAIAQFPPGPTAAPVCPAVANDGNYYGTATTGGDYGRGYIYQLTAAAKINIFYNFTGGADGNGPNVSPVQASDGNLYWYYGETMLRYSATTGLLPIPVTYLSADQQLFEASDENFYILTYDGVTRVTPSGDSTIIYTPPAASDTGNAGSIAGLYSFGNTSYPLGVLLGYSYTNTDDEDGCQATGNYFPMQAISLAGSPGAAYFSIGSDGYYPDGIYASADQYAIQSLVFGGNGTLYAALVDTFQQDPGGFEPGNCPGETVTTNDINQTYSAASAAPISMAFEQMHIKPGGSTTLNWQALNAYSDTMQQCYAFGGLSGFSGKVAPSGSATVTSPTQGDYAVSLVCGGTEAGFATLIVTDTLISLSSSATQVTQGAPVTLTATIGDSGTPLPTGKVNFMVGTTVIGSDSLANFVATFTASTAGIPPGTYNVVASYAGDASYSPATSSAVAIKVIAKAATTTALMPSSQTLQQGAATSITATVTGNTVQGAPTGSVKFMLGSTLLATATLAAKTGTVSSATYSASTAAVPPGTYSLTASYGGDSHNLPSTSTAAVVTVTAKPAPTPVTLAISPNPVPANTSFTLTATVKGKDTPSGTVFFYGDGTQLLSSTNVSGGAAQVTLPAGTLATGTYQITAAYAGDTNNPSGTSPAVSLTVQ